MIKKILSISAVIITLFCFNQNLLADNLRCLTFNIWNGGRHVKNGMEKAANIAKKLDADVVCYIEVNYKKWDKEMLSIYKSKGMNYNVSQVPKSDVCLLSKYPIKSAKEVFHSPNSGVKYELDVNGKIVTVFAIHLDWKGYASNLARGYNSGSKKYPKWKMIDDGNGKPKPITNVKEILKNNAESKRISEISSVIKSASTVKTPIIIMGDFNEPSFLDWTRKTKDMFAHNGVIIEWPATKALHKAGFKDAFREQYPNELLNPGITWPSVFEKKNNKTTWAPKSDDRDRIDYFFFKGKGIKLNSIGIVGPKASFKYSKATTENTENDNFLLPNEPWPSDHKALFAEFILQ